MIRSPETIPNFDILVIDGYTLNSEVTVNATKELLAMLSIRGIMTVGDEPIPVSGDPVPGSYPCVEIITGACSPKPFDCCVRVEDATIKINNIKYLADNSFATKNCER